MSSPLIPHLERLLCDLQKAAARCEQKGKEALFVHKPFAELSAREREKCLRTSSNQKIKKSDLWMRKQIDAECAADELRNIIFMAKAR